MQQLQHALKLLSYRMRRYPLWIVVIITAIPLFLAARWVAQRFSWTSSHALSQNFIRVDDRFWVRSILYAQNRDYDSWRPPQNNVANDDLIDLDQRSMTPLRPVLFSEPLDTPHVLKNGTLMYHSHNSDRALILNPRSAKTTQVQIPTGKGIFIDGRFFVYTSGQWLYSTDVIEPSPAKRIKLPLFQYVTRVDDSPHVLLWTNLENVMGARFYNIRKESPLLDGTLRLMGNYGILIEYLEVDAWGLLSLYKIDTDGAHWKSTWASSYANFYAGKTSHGLIETPSLFSNRIDIRQASTNKIMAMHPLVIRNEDGAYSSPGELWLGALKYNFPDSGYILIDPTQPGRVILPLKSTSWPYYDYDSSRQVYWVHNDPGSRDFWPSGIDIRDRDTSRIISTWKSEKWFGSSQPLGFGSDDSTLFATDDYKCLLAIDVKTGKEVLRIEPYSNWLVPFSLLTLSAFVWYISFVLSCEQLRIPKLLQPLAPLMMVLALVLIRLSSIGHPEFVERFSYQTIMAIAFLVPTFLAIHIWPNYMPKVALLLGLTFLTATWGILVVKFRRSDFSPIETSWSVMIAFSSAVLLMVIFLPIRQLTKGLLQPKIWRLSLSPTLLWLTLACIAVGSMKHFFFRDGFFSIYPWVDFSRILFYPVLILSLWWIIACQHSGLRHKTAISTVWIAHLCLLRLSACQTSPDSSDPLIELTEDFFYSCCATLPVSILCFAYFVPIPRWLTRFSKQRLAVRR
jgi:hypothetical protein